MKKTDTKFYFDKSAADHAVNWIEKYCTHPDGDLQGQKIVLEEWQKDDIIRPLFGWKHKITKLRKHKTVFFFIAKKNAKTTLASCIGLYCLMGLPANGVNVICAAASRDQAGILFTFAKNMVLKNKKLSSLAKPFQNSIVYKNRPFKVISAEASTKHGFIPYVLMIDEVHAHKNRELIDTLRTGVVSRDEPITIYMTTAGTDIKSVAYELYEYAKKVKAGEITDDSFLPILYEAPKDLDIFDEETWKLANPGFGVLVKRHYFIEETNKIKNQPSLESAFRRLHLNQWIGTEETWLSDQDYMKCSGSEILQEIDGMFSLKLQGKELFNFHQERLDKLRGRECILGLDLASVRDFCALTALFPPENEGEKFELFCWFWLPQKALDERLKSIDVDFIDLVDQGFLSITPGNATDYRIIEDKIYWLFENYMVKVMGYDASNASQMIINLQEEGGIGGDYLDPVSQYLSKISTATKEWERLIITQNLTHWGNPILRWMNGNVKIRTDRNANIGVERGDTKRKNVDGIVSGIISIDAYMGNSNEASADPNKVYADEANI